MSSEDFGKFISNFDLRNPVRAEWRDAVRGKERDRLQLALLDMATDSFYGTERDQLGIYKAAHSVLPLKGRDLSQLALLLTKYPEGVADWLDVFVEALSQKDSQTTMLPGQVMQVLHNHLTAFGEAVLTDSGFLCACNQIYHLGYRPSWIEAIVDLSEQDVTA